MRSGGLNAILDWFLLAYYDERVSEHTATDHDRFFRSNGRRLDLW